MRKLLFLTALSLAPALLTACAGASADMAAMSPMSAPAMEPMAESAGGEALRGSATSGDADGIADEEDRRERIAQAPPPPPAPPGGAQPPQAPPTTTDARAPAGEIAAIRGPMLIYTADITMAVFEVNTSLDALENLARQAGGFLARRDDRSITIRIPAARFDEAIGRIEKLGDILNRNVVAQDVTEEFHDLEVRLKSAHAVQERLIQLLAKAQKVEESVMIERELARVTTEIDRIEGRMKFLRDRAAYSTITVTFQPKATESIHRGPFHLPGPWLYQLGLGRLLNL